MSENIEGKTAAVEEPPLGWFKRVIEGFAVISGVLFAVGFYTSMAHFRRLGVPVESLSTYDCVSVGIMFLLFTSVPALPGFLLGSGRWGEPPAPNEDCEWDHGRPPWPLQGEP